MYSTVNTQIWWLYTLERNWPDCENAERYRCQRGKDTDTFLREQKYFGLVFQCLHVLSVGYYTFAFRAVCFLIFTNAFQSTLSEAANFYQAYTYIMLKPPLIKFFLLRRLCESSLSVPVYSRQTKRKSHTLFF
jgi:hypothetical protein